VNDETFQGAFGAPGPAFKDAFIRHYEAIHSGDKALSGEGVVVSVIGPAGFAGSAALAAKPDLVNAVTIGRHGHADLFLPEDPTLSLRQAAVIVYPRRPGSPVRFRVLDLRSSRPFEDEQGRALEALEAEGPVLLRVGAYALFVLPHTATAGSDAEAGPVPDEPGAAERAWEHMPERAYRPDPVSAANRRLDAPRFSPSSLNRAARSASDTLVLPLPGPVFEHERLQNDGELPRGRLVVRSEGRELTLVLGDTAASRGVILGRYERCDGGGSGILSSLGISRVHALVIQIAGQVYAIDAGSTNGLWTEGGDRVREAKLLPGRHVRLAQGIATVAWGFTH